MLWGSVIAVIVYIEPDLLKDIIIPGSYLPFFGLATLAIWYTLALLIRSIWKSLILTLTIVGALALTTMRLMHIGLAFVLLLTLVTQSWYIYHSHEKIKPANESKNRGTGL